MDADKRKGLTMKKVSLRELVADKIIFSILIAMYYWMWARNDWKDYYTTVQDVIFAFSFYCDWLYLRCRPYGSYHRNHRLWLDGRTDFDFGGAHDHLLSYG